MRRLSESISNYKFWKVELINLSPLFVHSTHVIRRRRYKNGSDAMSTYSDRIFERAINTEMLPFFRSTTAMYVRVTGHFG